MKIKQKILHLQAKVMSNHAITYQDAEWLMGLNDNYLPDLFAAANSIRHYFCGNHFDLCTILNGKSGRCSEDCHFCAQSCLAKNNVPHYNLLPSQQITQAAYQAETDAIPRFSVVTSGRMLSETDVQQLCQTMQKIKTTTNLSLCLSAGLLSSRQYRQLREAGVDRMHNNLETSERYFPVICTTHTYQHKLKAIQAAQAAGFEVCCGGIFGLGESASDRIALAFALKNLGITSIPMNLLQPIQGTPLAAQCVLSANKFCQIIAVYRFILPKSFIRLAGGRALLPDQGKQCFQAGANAAITGDMLTTAGATIQSDLVLLEELGFSITRPQI